MHLKKRVSFILFLCQLSLLSIGFASWYIGNDASSANKIVEGGIKTEDITNINDCINLSNLDNNFEYGKYGFTDSNNNYVKSCNVCATYTLNLDLCRSVYSGFDSLAVTVNIEYNDDVLYSLFENVTNKFTFSCEIKYKESTITMNGSPTIDSCQYKFNFNLSNVLNEEDSTASLSINFVWRVEDKDYFNSYIYPKLVIDNENKVNFILGTSIVGV